MPNDEQQPVEPRKKRAKIVSACSECRRKKTKCNGEQPCRSCQKSSTPCVYPAYSQNDDRRNFPSRVALEAIEERLKTIEDMLRTILQSKIPLADSLDPVAVSNFLTKDKPSSSSSASPVPTTSIPQTSSSPLRPATTSSVSPPLSSSANSPPPIQRPVPKNPSPVQDYRLPSIHSLSAPPSVYPRLSDAPHDRDLPPIAFQPYHHYPPHSYSQLQDDPSGTEEYALQLIKKRKR